MSTNLCRVKLSFKPHQNEHNSAKDIGEKCKRPCNIEPKISMNILFHYPPNTKILKDFLKTFPTKMKPKCPAKEEKGGNKREKRGEERKQKVKVKTVESLSHPKTILEFCFLRMPEIRKLIFCIWIRRPQGERPVGFIASF